MSDLTDFLAGKSALAPAELFLAVSPHAVVLYLLIRSLGEGRDTFRSKPSIAEALGWDRKTVFRVGAELEEAGWLVRKSENRKGRWRSTWTVLPRPTKRDGSHETGRVPLNGTGPIKRDATRPIKRDATRPTKRDENTPPHPTRNTPPTAGGSAPSNFLTEDEAWSLIPSSVRDARPVGAERLREGMRELLEAGDIPPACVIFALLGRLQDTLPLTRISSPTRVLASAARKVDPAEAAAWLAQRQRACAKTTTPAAPAYMAPEQPDPEVLAGLDSVAAALAAPKTNTRRPLRARSANANAREDLGRHQNHTGALSASNDESKKGNL